VTPKPYMRDVLVVTLTTDHCPPGDS